MSISASIRVKGALVLALVMHSRSVSYSPKLGDRQHLAPNRPQSWTGNDLIWSFTARVDGVAYNLFGVHIPSEHLLHLHSIFTVIHPRFLLPGLAQKLPVSMRFSCFIMPFGGDSQLSSDTDINHN
ncbi:hypothetical protein N7445_002089 [Penicillium cf. griseofulvum]|nr:hypothetical protein N7445_002089 [Penicillium cf. griseofulvum]